MYSLGGKGSPPPYFKFNLNFANNQLDLRQSLFVRRVFSLRCSYNCNFAMSPNNSECSSVQNINKVNNKG